MVGGWEEDVMVRRSLVGGLLEVANYGVVDIGRFCVSRGGVLETLSVTIVDLAVSLAFDVHSRNKLYISVN